MGIRMLAAIFIGILLGVAGPSIGEGHGYFHLDADLTEVRRLADRLQLEKATEQLTEVRRDQPHNLLAHHLANYIDFLKVYISEEEGRLEAWKARLKTRLEAVALGDAESPYYSYVQAEMRLMMAMGRLKFGEYLGAFRELRKAYRLLAQNRERFPHFAPGLRDLGLLHAIVGTLPGGYRWSLSWLAGIRGDLQQGRREMEQALRYPGPHLQETWVLYSFLLLHLAGEPESAWKALQSAELTARESPLHAFLLANAAMQTQRNEEALRVLDLYPRGADFFPFPYLHFMRGLARLRKLDSGGRIDLLAFVRESRGRHFIKEAHQKIAWSYLLEGDRPGYHLHMSLCLLEGERSTGNDEAAWLEARKHNPPQLALLRARLLCDGAYFERAFAVLRSLSPKELSGPELELEYDYRLGRILQGLQQPEAALRHFEELLEKSDADKDGIMRCRAALEAGRLCEALGRLGQAALYFRHCLDIRPKAYATALHHQAKAGLARVNGKQR